MTRLRAVVVSPPDLAGRTLLQSDLAGLPAGDHLRRTLDGCAEIEILALDADVVRSSDDAAQGLLIVDARAWLSADALRSLLEHAREAPGTVRIIESPARVAATTAARSLAVYLPAQHTSRAVDVASALGAHTGPDDLLIDGAALDAAQPAILIDSSGALADCERRLLITRATRAMQQGVRLRDPGTVYIRGDLSCGAGVEIDANVIIEGDVTLGDGVRVGANSIIRSARVGAHTRIQPFSLVEHAAVGAGSLVGPYGRIRPGTALGDGVQIGNFVEIKNSTIGAGSRINHHSFIGDATLADRVTIGAGTITCNHDGVGSNPTTIDADAYVGSGCNLVAPVHVGEGATIGAGSTITRDVPPAALTLARAPQTTITGWHGPKARRDPQAGSAKGEPTKGEPTKGEPTKDEQT
jgi:bifunctional UDP-N-acetylglucosamine pyrophosphorylase/glucosamine-1-phosphate N-acetyltransferase